MFVCSADDARAQEIRDQTVQDFTSLGFTPQVLLGFTRDGSKMKGVTLRGVTSVFGFATSVIPQILAATAKLSEKDVFVVVEDSAWPTTSCTPANLVKAYVEHGMPKAYVEHGMPIWRGAYKSPTPRNYSIQVRSDGRLVGRADTMSTNPAGCKMFVAGKEDILAPGVTCGMESPFRGHYGFYDGPYGSLQSSEGGHSLLHWHTTARQCSAQRVQP